MRNEFYERRIFPAKKLPMTASRRRCALLLVLVACGQGRLQKSVDSDDSTSDGNPSGAAGVSGGPGTPGTTDGGKTPLEDAAPSITLTAPQDGAIVRQPSIIATIAASRGDLPPFP